MSSTDCPTGCGGAVRPGQLLCGRCWHRVPQDLQRSVWRTWRAYTNDPTSDHFAEWQLAANNATMAAT